MIITHFRFPTFPYKLPALQVYKIAAYNLVLCSDYKQHILYAHTSTYSKPQILTPKRDTISPTTLICLTVLQDTIAVTATVIMLCSDLLKLNTQPKCTNTVSTKPQILTS